MRVYNEYVKDKPAVYVRIVPEGELDTLVIPDNWTFPGRNIPELNEAEEPPYVETEVVDTFDRSIMPSAGPIPALQSLESWTATLDNGIEVIGVQTDEIPTTAMLLRMKFGQRHESRDKLGVGNLTAYIMNEATELNSAEDLNIRLASVSSTLRFYTDGEYTYMSVGGLTSALEETLEVGTERLLLPKFAQEDFDRWKNQALELLSLGEDNASEVANLALTRTLFGDDNHFSYSSLGLPETVEALTLEDVREFYAEHYSPSDAEILVISDLSKEEMLEKLAPLESWEAKLVPNAMPIEAFPDPVNGAIYFVHKENAQQSELRVASLSVPYDATGEYYRLNILNHSLAGSFNSRINLNLREDKGYTYGAFAYIRSNEDFGRYVIQTSVRKDVTAAALKEIYNEIDGMAANGPTDDELEYTRQAMSQKDALSYETPNHKVNIIALTQRFGLDPDWPQQQNAILKNITSEELNQLAKKHLNADEMITIVVGDRETVLSDLKELGRPIIELD